MYSAEEIEIGKLYKRGSSVVILRERTGEQEKIYKQSLCNVYIFDELKDFIVQDFTIYKTSLHLHENCKVLLNPDYKCFEDFNLDEFNKEKIEPLMKQVNQANNFIKHNL